MLSYTAMAVHWETNTVWVVFKLKSDCSILNLKFEEIIHLIENYSKAKSHSIRKQRYPTANYVVLLWEQIKLSEYKQKAIQ